MPAAEDDVPKRAKRQPTGDYEVGYGRPPKHGQFQKGAPSKNPRGRGAKKPLKPDEMADAVSRMKVPIGGGRDQTTAFEVVWKAAFNMALMGNRKAQAEVLRQREAFEAVRPLPPEPEWRFRRITEYHDGVPVKVVDRPCDGMEGDPIPPPRKKCKPRRRKNETYLETFDRIASMPVKVGIGRKKKRVSAEHAIWLSIFADASKGDDKALRLVTRYAKHARGLNSKSDDGEDIVFTLNIGNAPVISEGPTVSFTMEDFE